MADERTVLLVGYPESGKTTYLAALWQVLSVGDVEGSLQVVRLTGNLAHLKAIHDAWLKCQRAVRTPREATEIVTLELRSEAGTGGTLVIPDLAGDLIADYMLDRAWPSSFNQSVRSAAGLLVFVHAGTVDDGVRTEDVVVWTAHVDDEAAAAQPDGPEDPTTTDFDPGRLPTQVMLVDLLQQLRARSDTVDIVIVVSAWDTVPHGLSPTEWLTARLPLLSQYLAANVPGARVFGVSAQGGRLPEQSEELAAKERPSERILVTDGSDVSSDASWPIRSLLAGT